MDNEKLLRELQSNTNENEFVIRILSREHDTWQGTVEWITKGKTCPFRSALEMICLLQSAMDEAENKNT